MNERLTPRVRHSPEVRDAIEAYAHRLLEHIQYRAQHQLVSTVDDFRDDLPDLLSRDGTEVIGLSIDELLGLVEDHAADLDLQLHSVAIDSLRLQIESLAALVIDHLGEERASELLLELEQFMNRHDLELENLTMANHLSIVAHDRERTESDGSTVYEYRGIDGRNIDVYEVRLGGRWPVFFQKVLPAP